MARRSKFSLEFTPPYGSIGEPDSGTVKIYYSGKLKFSGKHDEYTGGSVEYFDFVDLDKLGTIELWGYAEDLGFKDKESIKFWHKYGCTFGIGTYLETDLDVLKIRNHVPRNYEVEIYIEHFSVAEDDSDENFDDDIEDDNEESIDVTDDLPGRIENTADLPPVLEKDDDVYEEDICVDSDGFASLHDFDEEHVRNFPIFDPAKDSEDPKLELGLVFSSKKEAKFTIESQCIRTGRAVKFIKNDTFRLRAKCINDECQWMIHVVKMTNDNCWQVRSLEPNHSNCSRGFENKCINSTWLGKTFAKRFSTNPKLAPHEFRQEICSLLHSNISNKVAYNAKRKALMLVQGTAEEQFRQIRNYCAELKRSDDGATIVLKLTEDNEGPRFQRLYVCFSACRQGFKYACRHIIGVDGCFLKVPHGGQLLLDVGLDPNNNTFSICYAMVERETKDSWTWFLRLLDEDIGVGNGEHAWTFMSDKQKGLIPALESLFPEVEHRFCVRHLHSNMKHDGFKGMAITVALWAVAKLTRIEEFRRRMVELKHIDEKAYEWLANKPEYQWSKAYFSTLTKSDILLNNMCEIM